MFEIGGQSEQEGSKQYKKTCPSSTSGVGAKIDD